MDACRTLYSNFCVTVHCCECLKVIQTKMILMGFLVFVNMKSGKYVKIEHCSLGVGGFVVVHVLLLCKIHLSSWKFVFCLMRFCKYSITWRYNLFHYFGRTNLWWTVSLVSASSLLFLPFPTFLLPGLLHLRLRYFVSGSGGRSNCHPW
jgi:hypothetical protein